MPTRSAASPPSTPVLTALAVAPLVAGTAIGLVTNAAGQPWYRRLSKPAWTPPSGVFGPVWTVLYLLMGLALVLVVREDPGRPEPPRPRVRIALGAFATQLVLNLLWSVVFFGARRVRLAAVEIAILWTTIVATVAAFARVRPLAGAVLLPYLAWTTFAGLLNLDIARRNPER